MALANNLIVQVLRTSRNGTKDIRVDFRVFAADGTTLLFHGGMQFQDLDAVLQAVADDKPDFEEAVHALLKACLNTGTRTMSATVFDDAAGKRFKVTQSVNILP